MSNFLDRIEASLKRKKGKNHQSVYETFRRNRLNVHRAFGTSIAAIALEAALQQEVPFDHEENALKCAHLINLIVQRLSAKKILEGYLPYIERRENQIRIDICNEKQKENQKRQFEKMQEILKQNPDQQFDPQLMQEFQPSYTIDQQEIEKRKTKIINDFQNKLIEIIKESLAFYLHTPKEGDVDKLTHITITIFEYSSSQNTLLATKDCAQFMKKIDDMLTNFAKVYGIGSDPIHVDAQESMSLHNQLLMNMQQCREQSQTTATVPISSSKCGMFAHSGSKRSPSVSSPKSVPIHTAEWQPLISLSQ